MNQLRRLFTVCFVVAAFLIVAVSCCTVQNTSAKVSGHYTYQHAFEYDLEGNHFKVNETGTMDFYPDGTALDSA